jgi:Mn-containing catalase
MFGYKKETAYYCRPDAPESVYARKLKELIGGQWGEIRTLPHR